LPDFPWDRLEPAKAVARSHPGGIVDLSIGTPVDPVPSVVRAALAAGSDTPGYPQTAGSPALRAAAMSWVSAACGAVDGFAVLPTIGSKELIGSLPTLLGVGPGDTVVIPSVCYPTYEVGALLAGATVVRADSPADLGSAAGPVRLVWVNSPSNPTGQVASAADLRAMIDWARAQGAVLASDECYLTLPFESTPTSALAACGDTFASVLAVHSLSKRSNMAGYRAGLVAGDPALIASLLEIRKHAGLMVPAPVQAAMIAALGDNSHVIEQQIRYARRRSVLRGALEHAGFRISYSEAGLYLWASRDENCWETVDWLARRGILVAPGAFYGPTGEHHVRVALTATDERVEAAATRLRAAAPAPR
jgi:succinyldiaminopimelate transaminase